VRPITRLAKADAGFFVPFEKYGTGDEK